MLVSIFKVALQDLKHLFETPVMTYEFRPFIMPKTMELIINVENGQRQPIKNTHVLLKDVLNLAKQPYKILTSIYSNENFYGFLVTDCTYFDLEILFSSLTMAYY